MSRGVMIAIGVGIAVALAVGSPRCQGLESNRAFYVDVSGSGQPILLIPGCSSTGEVRAGLSAPRAVGIAMAEMLTTDLRNQAKAIDVPVLLIGALGAIPEKMRPALRAAYEEQVAALPSATVVFAERARHFVMLDDPSFLYETLDRFLPSMLPSAR